MTSAPILIVEDDRAAAAVAAAVLQQAGHQAVAAHDAMQGFAMAQRLRPKLILLDLQMPAGGGESLWKRLKSSTFTSLIPVVIMTSSTTPGLEQTMLAQGAAGFVPKPVDDERLRQAVTRALAGR